MEILDKVYGTFKRLDQDFARSKKTRTEFIKGKFGGDIRIGSILILSAIGTPSDSADIEKLSFVNDIFAKLLEAQDRLDSLPNFKFESTDNVIELLKFIGDNHSKYIGVQEMEQETLYKKYGALQYHCGLDGSVCASAGSPLVFVYNENMEAYMQSLGWDVKGAVGTCFHINDGVLRPVTDVKRWFKNANTK